ncbi:MAG: energy transducer TonB [Breznakibacter sp.]
MEVRRSLKVDLSSKKTLFMQVGLIVVFMAALVVLEWIGVDVQKAEKVKSLPPSRVSDVLAVGHDGVKPNEESYIVVDMGQSTEPDSSAHSYGVGKEEDIDDAPVFFIVEEMPEFPGGNEALQTYIANSIKYPVIAKENDIQGRVYVSFVVSLNGSVEQVKIARGIDPYLDKEAIRVVQSMPAWKPGRQRGEPVKVSYTVPINFVLQ